MKLTLLFALLILFALPVTSYAATYSVHQGGDLQGTLNNAQLGDTIILDAGVSYPGTITLPANKTGIGYITIESSALINGAAFPDAVHRVSQSDSSNMPKILSPGFGTPALQTAAGASYYKLIGIEFRTTSASDFAYDLIELGSSDAQTQSSLDKVPHHLIFDRCLITAFSMQSLKRGITLNSSETTIQNCYIAGFKSTEQEAQAVGGWNGPGPFHIINNYLEASGENLIFGGARPTIEGLVPSDIEIKNNYLYKQSSWRSQNQVVKNLFELKSARRVLFEGNTLENCWRDNNYNDGGYGAINLVATTTHDDSGEWATVEDVTIRDNVMMHTPNVMNILGNSNNMSGLGVTVENNLFIDANWNTWGNPDLDDNSNYRGYFIKMSQMPHVVVNHNTVFQSGNIISVYGGADTGFVFTNNIVNYNNGIGIFGVDNNSQDGYAMSSYFPDGTLSKNAMIGDHNSQNMLGFASQNFYPATIADVDFVNYAGQDYRLAGNSPYKSAGTDGKDIGVDVNRNSEVSNGIIQLQFSAPTYSVGEGSTDANLIVTRSGDSSYSATVGYATSDPAGLTNCNVVGTGIASSRCDYTTTIGTLQFVPGETSKTISIPIVDDAYAEGNESFSITLSHPMGASLGLTSSATITIIDNDASNGANPIDGTPFFVRQQYIDFLGRGPDAGGYSGWQNTLNNCPASGIDSNGYYCDRIEVSADFFRSEEFQTRGYFIYRFYKTLPGVSDPNNPQFGHLPHYSEFVSDFARVSGFLSADQLEANKVDFVNDFVSRGDFATKYGTLTDPTAYVDALLQTVGLQNHPTRQTWINSLTNGSMTRAQVLRALVESAEMYQKYYNEGFVIMEYFGYLRRDADGSYVNWISTMNQTNGDYRAMVNGFMNSAEYRQRFGY